MSLRISTEAPNFTANTTHGPIDFHTWIGDSWTILFSHPRISLRSAQPNWATWLS